MKANSVECVKENVGMEHAGKTFVFGMLKRQDKVYTVVVENTKTSTLMAKIARKNVVRWYLPDSLMK